jgi:ATP-dependent helicase HrpB
MKAVPAQLSPISVPDLPVRAVLPQLHDALRSSGAAVLVAPPGTGKTTLAPLAMSDWFGGRVVVTEPRRLAARAAASRMASLTGTPVGRHVGFAVRGERRSSAETIVEVVTTGVLLRRLQRDPSLRGVSAVVVDECHERQLETDLVLGMLTDVREALREDLTVVATSATAQARLFAQVLASGIQSEAPVVTASVPVHPLEIRWEPAPSGTRPPMGSWVDPGLLDHVARVARSALKGNQLDALVLVPGAWEVDRVCGWLRTHLEDTDVLRLHGRLSSREQDEALRPGPRRRVVVSTAVAESSLTVPGVRVVVDAGLARRPRTDHARGLSTLVTTRVSRAEAEQRAGRANREGSGLVVRCWTEAEHQRLAPFPPPEVDQADLTGFALELACWGAAGGRGIRLPTAPPAGPMQLAEEVLRELGAVGEDGRVTANGRRMVSVPAHPRLARALMTAAQHFGSTRAAEVVALLAADRGVAGDVMAQWRAARGAREHGWVQLSRQLASAVRPSSHPDDDSSDDVVAGTVVATAFPERIARLRPDGADYLMAGGTAARLAPGSSLAGAPWIAIAVAERRLGQATAVARAAVVIHEDVARSAGAHLLTTVDEVGWVDGDVVARRVERLGAIELHFRSLRSPEPGLVRAALLDGLRREGLGLLRWTEAGSALRERLAFLHRSLGEPWPDVSDSALLERLEEWLRNLSRARRRADLERLDTTTALRALLPWPDGARLDMLAPERITVPSGSRVRVDYGGEQPVLAARLQELFGWAGPSRVADGRVAVVLHVLSPAGRPVAVTADLESFWRNGYAQVRSELRGRYPKHAWPEHPLSATPTRRAGRRRAQ